MIFRRLSFLLCFLALQAQAQQVEVHPFVVETEVLPPAVEGDFVADQLNLIPSLQIGTGVAGQPKYPMVRGLHSDALAVILDDLPLNASDSGFANLGALLSGSCGLTPQVQGFYESLYHTPGGVLALSVKEPQQWGENTITAEGGTLGTGYGHLQLNHKDPRHGVILHLEGYGSKGIPQLSRTLHMAEKNTYKNGSMASKVWVNVTPNLMWDMVVRGVDDVVKTNTVTPITGPPQDLVFSQMRFFRNKFVYADGGPFSHTLVSGIVRQRWSYPVSQRLSESVLNRYVMEYQPSASYKTRMGVEMDHQKADNAYAKEQRDLWNWFLMSEAQLSKDFAVAASGSWHKTQHFQGTPGGEIEVRYALLPQFFLLGGYKRSVQFPSLDELYGSGVRQHGNPLLQVKKSDTVETGVQYKGQPWEAKILYFQTRTRNFIVPVLVAAPDTWQAVNKPLTSEGVENSVSFRKGPWDLSVSYTYSQVSSPFQDLVYRGFAQHKVVVGIGKDVLEDSKVRVNMVILGQRKALDYYWTWNGDPVRLKPVVLLDAKWSTVLGPSMEAYVRVDNALNQRYEDIPGYRTPGLGIYAGFTASF